MPAPMPAAPAATRTIALLGNPNVGKTTLFNRLAGKRQKTANFPGTTQEAHVGTLAHAAAGDHHVTLIDLPGVYDLTLDTAEAGVCRGALEGSAAPEGTRATTPDALLIVLDATNLLRNLTLLAQTLARKLPTVVAVNQIDAASRRGIHIDREQLEAAIGCPVVLTTATTGEGVDTLVRTLTEARTPAADIPTADADITRWADDLHAEVTSARTGEVSDAITDRLDDAFTHPVLGVITFAAVMTGLFYVIFSLAAYPMEWIDAIFAHAGGWVASVMPEGAIRDLLVDGVIAGIGGTVIFLPQIVLLFFLISLLEHTGYLARAAFVIDRVLRPFGLPGHAFVPLLSAHACALPAIMSARAVPDRRDRLATILVAPFMSCTARIPVYVLLTTLLFPGRPAVQALAFTGCYVLGIIAGLLSALIARRSFLKGKSGAMALELPPYRAPSFISAVRTAADRGWMFLRKAGTVILAISIVLWWLDAYPVSDPPPEATELRTQAADAPPGEMETLLAEADRIESRHASRESFLGMIGSAAEPVFAPIGADRQLTVGILASFAAREVFVSTMAVQVAGTDDIEEEGVLDLVATAERDDGTPVFTNAAAWAMLVYFVLAMQCLPTLVVTAREAGGLKWAALQFGWMTVLAYGAACIVYQTLSAAG